MRAAADRPVPRRIDAARGVAMLLALALVELALPSLSAFLGADLALLFRRGRRAAADAGPGRSLVGVARRPLSGLLSLPLQPGRGAQGQQVGGRAAGSGRLRSFLVVGQFAVSIALIICTAIIYAQTRLCAQRRPRLSSATGCIIRSTNLAPLAGRPASGDDPATRSRRLPGVVAVGRADIGVAADDGSNTVSSPCPARPSRSTIGFYGVDAAFFRDDGHPQPSPAARSSTARPRDDRATIPPTERRSAAGQRGSMSCSTKPARASSASRARRPRSAGSSRRSSTATGSRSRRRRGRRRPAIRSMRDEMEPILFII